MFKTYFWGIGLVLLLILSGCAGQSVNTNTAPTYRPPKHNPTSQDNTPAQTGAQATAPTISPTTESSEVPLMKTGEAPLELTEEQNGGTVALLVNDTVRVRLDGNPTTGFTWETEKLDSSLLQQVGEPEFSRNSNLVGAGGAFTFTFKALKAGATHLRLIYHRTFEKGIPPAQVFDVSLDIQE